MHVYSAYMHVPVTFVDCTALLSLMDRSLPQTLIIRAGNADRTFVLSAEWVLSTEETRVTDGEAAGPGSQPHACAQDHGRVSFNCFCFCLLALLLPMVCVPIGSPYRPTPRRKNYSHTPIWRETKTIHVAALVALVTTTLLKLFIHDGSMSAQKSNELSMYRFIAQVKADHPAYFPTLESGGQATGPVGSIYTATPLLCAGLSAYRKVTSFIQVLTATAHPHFCVLEPQNPLDKF